MTQQHTPAAQAAKAPAAASTAVTGPLTMRDLVVLGAVAIIFIASVVPMVETLTGDLNLWNIAGLFYLAIGIILPLVVAALFLIRRLSPEVKFRVGSLSVDQFASVVASFAAFFFFVGTVTNFEAAYLVGLIGSLALLLATVCARWLPFFAADFANRAEVPAHVVARDAVAATKRPAAPKPVAPQANAAAQGGPAGQGGPVAGAPATGGQFIPGQHAPGQAAVHNAPQAQNTQGAWAGPQTAATPAGQIFTPAKTAGATAGAPAAAQSAAAAPATSGQSAAAAKSAATGAPTAAQASVPAASGATAAGKTDAHKADDGRAGATAATPAAATAADATAAVAPATASHPTEGAATTLNPQVAEPARERADLAARQSIAATVSPARAAVVAEPFWFAVDRPQNVIDEKTRQFAFKLMPGAWILALEDRGDSFVVQDSNGKTGVLLDLVGIERASDSQ